MGPVENIEKEENRGVENKPNYYYCENSRSPRTVSRVALMVEFMRILTEREPKKDLLKAREQPRNEWLLFFNKFSLLIGGCILNKLSINL